MKLSIGLTALALATASSALKAQKPDLVLPPDAKKSADDVRAIFLNSYDAYKYVLGLCRVEEQEAN